MAIENIFGAPPEYLSGLLGVDPDKLRKQALTTGLVNTALAFAAQPRNQNYGSVLPYAARALMAGQQGAQGVYQGALQDFQTRQKIEQAKRQQEQQQAQQELLAGITDPTQRLAAQLNPTEYAKAVLQPAAKRETFVAPDGSIRFKDTGELAQEANVAEQKERKTMLAPNGMLIYADTGEPVTQRSFAAPREPKQPSYKVETDATGKVVFIPQQPGSPIVDVEGRPTTYTPKDSTKAPTEGERKSATLLSRLEGSLKQLNTALKEKPTAATPNIASEAFRVLPFGAGEFAANLSQSQQRQRAEAAQFDIVDAALTLGTGASYTREQIEGYRKSYFPVLGDSPETVKDKQERLSALIQSARIAAGSLSESVPSGGFVNSEKQNILPRSAQIDPQSAAKAELERRKKSKRE